eukprot:scaffold674_cov130-Amphora_coffeaeformis.AAC.4
MSTRRKTVGAAKGVVQDVTHKLDARRSIASNHRTMGVQCAGALPFDASSDRRRRRRRRRMHSVVW